MSEDPDDDGACEIVSESGLDDPLDRTSEGDETIEDLSGEAIEDVGKRTLVVCDAHSCPGSEQARLTATFVPLLSSSISVASFSVDKVEI